MDFRPWLRIKEELLLERKISDLGLKIEGSAIESLIHRLYEELDQKGLVLKPRCFVADEWFVPVSIPVIGIPFYLMSPRLRRLEQKMVLEVEGGTRAEFMKLIRHEAGHAYSYAYNLYKKRKWSKLFGSAFAEYPDDDEYQPRPYSKSYVLHLDNWYAQSHPDEDFAETFAVWLTPGFKWRKRYRGWKALEKLEYVDQLMTEVAGKAPKPLPRFRPHEHAGLSQKLRTHYRKKRKQYEESFPDFYDRDLRILFTDRAEDTSQVRAHMYLKTSHQKILKAVALWTKEKKYTIDQLMKELISRTKELNLYVLEKDGEIESRVAAYITSLVTHHQFTGKFKRSK